MRVIALAAVLFLLAVSAGYGSSGRPVAASGAAALKGSGYGSVLSVSCAAPGDCAAGGAAGGKQAFVVNETNGSWGTPIKVPGVARLNTGGHAAVVAISCPAAGECTAGGYNSRGLFIYGAFVVSETNGVWGKAIDVPGAPTLNTGDYAAVDSISCAAVGECAAGGYYSDGSGQQAFVISETSGVWGTAVEVPVTATLNTGDYATVDSISCAAAGECAAAGYYTDEKRRSFELSGAQAFVVSETNGVWGSAIEVPGMAALAGGDSGVTSISCAAVGECAAGGWYTDDQGTGASFLVSEAGGSWGNAIEVPGMATLAFYGQAAVASVSCGAAGECAAGGSYYSGASFTDEAFVVSETNGSWGTAIEVPGMARLSGGYTGVDSVSCAAAGECAAAGGDGSDTYGQVFLVGETNGTWGKAIEVPGTAMLGNGGSSAAMLVSCAAAGECAAGGSLAANGSGRLRALVVSETNGSWGHATQLRNLPVSCLVPYVVGNAISAAKRRLNGDADCGVGKITYVYSKSPKGNVVAQHPASGTVRRAGARVALTVSKGRRT